MPGLIFTSERWLSNSVTSTPDDLSERTSSHRPDGPISDRWAPFANRVAATSPLTVTRPCSPDSMAGRARSKT
ncbi:MAG: hypothetical protein AAF360_03950 [Pseudomonadota bacterium]